MANHSLGTVLAHVRRIAGLRDSADLTDAQLLERFANGADESAFAALVHRHGPMVLGVCQRVLHDHHEADDAFQATFLVLMRKAATIQQPQLLANWLYGVAWRVARKARTVAGRRPANADPETDVAARELPAEVDWMDLRPVIDVELQGLPEKYRAPLVLHYLEGRTKDETARQLGWQEGTVSGRLARARDLLRIRLTRRGLALSAGGLAAVLTHHTAPAALAGALANSTVRTMLAYAADPGAEGVPSSVAALAEGVMQTMGTSKVKMATALVLAVSISVAGAGMLLSQPPEKKVFKPIVVSTDTKQIKSDVPALVQGNTDFALDLYGQLRGEKGNICYSPYSISTALAMTFAGARGQTAEEMAKVLHFNLAQERLHPACKLLVNSINAEGKKRDHELKTASALYGQKDFGFHDEFVALTRDHYGAGLQLVDFLRAREEARRTINSWVEKETRDRIKELITPRDLTRDTKLVLTNAIYFKAEWLNKFDKDDTREGDFHTSATEKVKTPLMYQGSKFACLEEKDFLAVQLPYKGKEVSMVVFLPRKVDGLAEFEKSLTAERMAGWIARFKTADVGLILPRFKIEGELRLKSTLSKLGMPTAFTEGADFSGMSTSGPLLISEVIHKTFVEVNESGTEAAGATAVIQRHFGEPRRLEFRADHPFLFVLRDDRSGSVLFVGRVANPK